MPHEKKSSLNNQIWTIIASGPSLTKEQVNYIQGKSRVIVINDNYRIAPWADCLYACDLKWWQWHYKDRQKELDAFQGEKWTLDIEAADRYGLFHIDSRPNCGLSIDPNIIHQGMNSGYQAINLAYHFGARKIILLGYDMQQTGGKSHWFGDHPDKSQPNYGVYAMMFVGLADHAKKLGLDIINCSEQTALTCFTRQDLRDTI